MRYIICTCAILSACATTGEVRTVQVPVSVPCLGASPKPPEYLFGIGAYPGEKDASRLLLRDFNTAKYYADELKLQMAGCLQATDKTAKEPTEAGQK